MHPLDWTILLLTLFSIVAYGVWKTRNINTSQSYLQGDRDLPWWTIGLSVMATQASAITFLSTPGQAYNDGMRFLQFYFGLPIAMVVLCAFALPLYYKLNVYTAYEYLERRFDLRARSLTAILFLIQRGLAAGLTIYAPSIVLSELMGWSLDITILVMGIFVIFYTVSGGTKAVSVTQLHQMTIILVGMVVAVIIIVFRIPSDIGFNGAMDIAGQLGKLKVVDTDFSWNNRYNIWSGLIAGTFLFLSYFGADQSQVQRYLSGKSLAESRMGLLFNGIFKVPMQFMILFAGILVFVFYQFNKPPVHFNKANVLQLEASQYSDDYRQLNARYDSVFELKQTAVRTMLAATRNNDETLRDTARAQVQRLQKSAAGIQGEVDQLILKIDDKALVEDTDYVFLSFIMGYMPLGMIGLLLAIIFSAAWSSTSSELSALATTTVVDIYRRTAVKNRDDRHYLNASRWFTVLWGALALFFAYTASLFENLIQAVNIIGSLFYGAILGIFFVAFFMKKIGGRAVFYAALIAEAVVLLMFYLSGNVAKINGILADWASNSSEFFAASCTMAIWMVKAIGNVSYLWYNIFGCLLVMGIAWVLEKAKPERMG
ncbi:MAG: sodium:solute symporter [Saprospiraceae bacterium]|nr:sodium:solute symporter [Saprospiraceae bacterium]